MTELTISILVHEDFSYIQNALTSIIQHTKTFHKIFVVINAGNEDQTRSLQQNFPDLHYIVNKIPEGFAANHNQIMRLAETPYIALLNDDIEIQGSALDTLIDYLTNNPEVGMVAPQLVNEDDSLQVTVYSDPSLFRMIYKISGLGRFTHQKSTLRRFLMMMGISRVLKAASFKTYDKPQAVDVLKGAALVVRKSMIDKVGLIDETTKAFGEEIDWDLRIRQAGWQVVIVPDAKITHFGLGQVLGNLKGWQIIEDRKGILNYYLKHRPTWEILVIRLSIIFFHGIKSFFTMFYEPEQAKTHLQTVWLGLQWQSRAQSPADTQ